MHDVVGRQLLEAMAARADDPVWTGFWTAVAFLGHADFFAVSLPLLFAWAPTRWSMRIALAFTAAATLSESLKVAFDRARPDPTEFGIVALEDPGAYENAAFPSGHTLMAVVLWGMVAWRSGSTIVRAICAVVIAAIATSRLALVRHDLLDVGAGFAFGAVLLFVLIVTDRRLAPALTGLPRVDRATLWLLAPLALQLALGLEITGLILGVGAGLGVGTIAAGGWRRRSRRVPVWMGATRSVLTVGGVALAMTIAEPGDGFDPMALFAIYFVAAVWVAGVVPALLGGVHEAAA